MRPVLDVAAMREADLAAQETTPVAVLMERAGTFLARGVLRTLGGAYGRRVTVVAGKGNNGGDGRVAAGKLALAGVRVRVVDATAAAGELASAVTGADAVVDAAYGTGFRGSYDAPPVPQGCAVIACDIPSGVDGDTGAASGLPMRADRTVTFAALKPGLLLGDGPALAGRVTVADIGVDVGFADPAAADPAAGRAAAGSFPAERTEVPARGRPRHPVAIGLVEDADVDSLVPARGRDTHKWRAAVTVVAGSPGMTGAAGLCARAALRTGSGMVRLAVPAPAAVLASIDAGDAVVVALPAQDWAQPACVAAERSRVLVAGPGLGRTPETVASVRRLVATCRLPLVLDADAVVALGGIADAEELLAARRATTAEPVVLTPHEGELASLAGAAPSPDRIAWVRSVATRLGAVVLLKGPTTVVADPGGDVRLADAGDARLATPGTGDVLAGMVAALVARGVARPLDAAALAAHAHGRAGGLGCAEGLVAGDLPDLVARWLTARRDACR